MDWPYLFHGRHCLDFLRCYIVEARLQGLCLLPLTPMLWRSLCGEKASQCVIPGLVGHLTKERLFP